MGIQPPGHATGALIARYAPGILKAPRIPRRCSGHGTALHHTRDYWFRLLFADPEEVAAFLRAGVSELADSFPPTLHGRRPLSRCRIGSSVPG